MKEKFTREELLERLDEFGFIDDVGFKLEGYETDKEIILTAVGAYSDEDMLQYVSKELFEDVDFLLKLIDVNAEAFSYAPDNIKGDKQIVLRAIKQTLDVIMYIPPNVIDKEIAITALEAYNENEGSGTNPFEHLPECFRSDRMLVDLAIKYDMFALRYVSEPLSSDRDFVLDILSSNREQKYLVLTESKVEAFKADKELVLKALENISKYEVLKIYDILSDELKSDKDIIPFLLINETLYAEIPDDLKEDKEFLLPCVERNPELFNELELSMRMDKDIAKIASSIQNIKYIDFELLFGGYKTRELALSACKYNGENLKHFEQFNDDKEIVLTAMLTSREGLRYASDELKSDADFLISVMTEHNGAFWLCDVSPSLFENDEFVKVAIIKGMINRECEGAFSMALEHIRDNEEIASIALTESYQNETPYISERLKADRNFLLKVSQIKGFKIDISELPLSILDDKEVMIAMFHSATKNSLEYLSDRLRSDYDVILEAVKVNGADYEIIGSAELKNNIDIILEAIRTYPEAYKALIETEQDTRENKIKAVEKNYKVLNYIYPEVDVNALRYDNNSKYNEEGFDFEIVLPGLKQNYNIFSALPIKLKTIESNARCVECIPKSFYNDREIMLKAVGRYDEAYRLCPQEFQDDVEFGLKALEAEELYGLDYKEPKRVVSRHFNDKLRDSEELDEKFLEYDVFTTEHL